jgi:uncharacterized protein (TIGR02246 family)
MHDDEQAIRQLVDNWIRATANGDMADLLTMVSEDVVFLTPGQAPMSRDDFAAVFLAAVEHVRIEASAEIQEIHVAGDCAYLWNRLDVLVTPVAGGGPQRRAGHTLTILHNENGRWVIARDANLLA